MIEIQINKNRSDNLVAKQPTNSKIKKNKVVSVVNKKKKFSIKNKKIFFNDLHVLLSSGIDLINALNIIENNFKEKDRQVIKVIIRDLHLGSSLFGSLENSGCFTPYEFFSVKIGEETGSLVKVMKEIGRYENERIEQKRKVISAFSYPIVVLATALLALVFMLNFIVPMFQEIFLRFDKELPYLTRLIIKVSDNFSLGLICLAICIGSGYLINKSLSNNENYLTFKAKLLIGFPLFGVLIKKVILARFALAMELLLSAKTPIVNCIILSRSMVSFHQLKRALEKIEADLLNGSSLHASMGQFKIFDLRMIELIKVAEEVNKLEDIFKQIKNQLNDEIEFQTGIISSALEPILIIFIGLLVGTILISMYLPIFQISNTFF